ncbi:MAG: hypothetical protein IJU70_09650 [Lentisphaeria bacterium]|nr:hypothetical protein [Lentisphaeria bacterium]
MKKFFFSIFLLPLLVFGTEEPVFKASFDENFSGKTARGTAEARVSQELLWETLQNLLRPGVAGNAALIGTLGERKEKLYHAVYRVPGIPGTTKGTVSFCVKPVDWSGEDRNFHVFFQAVGPNASLIIYKYVNSDNLVFLLGPSKPVGGKYLWSMAGTSIRKWKAGEWHHIAAAYDGKMLELFVDGRRMSKVPRNALPEKEFTQFSAGALSPGQWKTPLGLTLLDELLIFDEKLSPAAISRLAAVCIKNAGVPEIKETATIVDRKNNRLSLFFTAEGAAAGYDVDFSDKDGKKLFSRRITPPQARNKVDIDLNGFKPDVYTIRITGTDGAGVRRCVRELPFIIPQKPEKWKNNTLGLEKTVPAPWTPPRYDEKSGCVSGKMFSYDFANAPLPRQIYADGIPLFSRPVELSIDGKALDLRGANKSAAPSPETISLSSEKRLGGFRISANAEVQFDGFAWIKLVLTPEKNAEIKNLRLDFPFLPERSRLFNSMNKFYMTYTPGHCGKFASYSMNLYKRPPIMFVGDDNRGLQWFCEKLPHWHNARPNEALQLIPGKNENLLRLNLIDTKITVDRPLVYEFGIQSVPMRPMPENWRAWCPYRNFDPYFVWSKFHHYPYADALRTDEKFHEMKRVKTRRFGRELFYYFAGFTITPTFPEWPYYSAEWMLTPPEQGLYGCIGNPANYFTWICPQSGEYQDFYLDRLRTIIRKLDIPNIYIDNSDAQMCDNPRHGCGYTGSDGKHYSSFNLRATRRLAMRTYKMFKKLRPRGRIMRHMSAKPAAPVIAFADMLADGELYNKTVAMDESYFNIFSPDMFRASFRGTLWGVPQFFIPQFTRVIPSHNPARAHAWKTPEARLGQKDKIRHFKGYFLVHDTQIFPLFGVKTDDIEDIKARFGLKNETKFISYADASRPWRTSPGVLASGYVKGDKFMLIVMNEGSGDRAEVTLDAAALAELGIRNLRLRNAETGQEIAGKDGKIGIPLKRRDYMILWNI